MTEQGPFILSLIGNVLLSVVALLAFHVGRAAGRDERKPPRRPGDTNVSALECLTCRTKTSMDEGRPLHADSVDDFLHKHRGHGVRVRTFADVRRMEGPWVTKSN